MSEVKAEKELSKKELNKLKRKEGKKSGGDDTGNKIVIPDNAVKTMKLYYCGESTPELTFIAAGICENAAGIATHITKGTSHFPYLTYDPTGEHNEACSADTLSGDVNMARFLCRLNSNASGSALCGGDDAFHASLVDQWLNYSTALVYGSVSSSEAAELLNNHLQSRTYLVNDVVTLGDIACYVALKREKFVPAASAASGSVAPAQPPHTLRWYKAVEAYVKKFPGSKEVIAATMVKAAPVKKEPKGDAGKGKAKQAADEEHRAADDGAVCPPLVDGVEGEVSVVE